MTEYDTTCGACVSGVDPFHTHEPTDDSDASQQPPGNDGGVA